MIAVVGTGPMGTALAEALNRTGPAVLHCGVRETARWNAVAEAGVVMLALPFGVAFDLMTTELLGSGGGRVLVDVTNPAFDADPFPVPVGRSGGEVLADSLTGWRVVKAFNTVPAALMATPTLDRTPVTVPVAGDDLSAKQQVCQIALRLGFDSVDAGDIAGSRELESLACLLMRISKAHGYRSQVGFRLERLSRRHPAAPAAEELTPRH